MSGSPRGRGSESSGAAMSASRGGVLVGIAVVVGLLIFTVINRGGPTPATSTTPVTEPSTIVTVPATNADGTTVTTLEGTTDTTKAKKGSSKNARTNDQVVVQVLNGSGVQGAATQRSNDLKAKGYQVLPAGNAPATRDGTGVQCVEGYEKEAEALVATLGELSVPATVETLSSPLPAGFDPAANCYVLLGR